MGLSFSACRLRNRTPQGRLNSAGVRSFGAAARRRASSHPHHPEWFCQISGLTCVRPPRCWSRISPPESRTAPKSPRGKHGSTAGPPLPSTTASRRTDARSVSSRRPSCLRLGHVIATAGQAAISARAEPSRAVRSRLAPSCGSAHNSGNADWGGAHMPDAVQESRTLLRAERESAATALSDLEARLADLDRAIEALGPLAGRGGSGRGDGRRGGRPAAARGQGRSVGKPRRGTTTPAIETYLSEQGRTAVHATQILEHLQTIGRAPSGMHPKATVIAALHQMAKRGGCATSARTGGGRSAGRRHPLAETDPTPNLGMPPS